MLTKRVSKCRDWAGLALVLAAAFPLAAMADSESMSGLLMTPGSAGLGAMLRSERSPYDGAGIRHDLVPLYLYEGERFFLHPTRGGMKLFDDGAHRIDAFVDLRLEGFPHDNIPASLAGMQLRETSTDIGLSYERRAPWGTLRAEVVHDALDVYRGYEGRLGYSYDWSSGPWHLQPGLMLKRRSANLNNYYYGVRPEEAMAGRPTYMPGAGTDVWIGVYGFYAFSGGWRILGGWGYNFLDSNVRRSPIVLDGNRPTVFVGAAYDFGSHHRVFEEKEPLIVKALYGRATDCHLNKTMLLRCVSTDTVGETRVAGIELGRPFITGLKGWPLDFVGYISLLHHDDKDLQSDATQFNVYMKAFYYGFPWSGRIRTRVGFGAGVSIVDHVPFNEARGQALRGKSTSRMLNYLDPTVDISIGDLFGSRAMKETYLGVGVSHRSGIFGSSRMLGNVDGGSNYIYTYVEWKLR